MSAEVVVQMAALARELPEDLVRIILSMLPVKSLMRFKCVRKSWYALIKSPNFVDLHLKNQNRKKDECVIVNRFLEHHNRFVLSFFSNETLDDLSINIDTPFSKREFCLLILGPCNGLICITNYHDIVLSNPSIREFKSLTVPRIFGNPDKMVHSPRGVGFGFDPITGDYKVVRIVNHFYDDDDNVYDPGYHKAEVYNLSTNSWRELNATVPAHVSNIPCFETLFNGAFHWYATKDSRVDEWILSFNFSNEVMQLMPLPDICYVLDGHSRRLAIINESLALIRYEASWYRSDLVEKYFDIWVMNEYGVRESWTRLFKIGPLLGIEYPLVFWKNSELLLESSNGQLVSCDLQHQNVKQFPIHGVPSLPGVQITLGVVTYSESLVSVNVKNEREESA